MLKWRILTALVLIPPLIAAPFVLSTWWLAPLFGVFVVAGAWEWAQLNGLSRRSQRLLYAAAIAAFGVVLLPPFLAESDFAVTILALVAVFWVWALLTLGLGDTWRGGVFHGAVGKGVSGAMVLVPSWLASLYLHAHDPQRPWLLLYLFVLTWGADTFAYFFGSVFGRTRLAPAISPGKTIEGLAGALLVCVLFALVCGTMFWKFEGLRLALWVALAAVTVLVSVLGDLLESKLKRLAGAKDSGRLLPGHGGVLDRIDSYTAAAPLFVLGWMVLLRSPL